METLEIKFGTEIDEEVHAQFKAAAARRKMSMKAATRAALVAWSSDEAPTKSRARPGYKMIEVPDAAEKLIRNLTDIVERGDLGNFHGALLNIADLIKNREGKAKK